MTECKQEHPPILHDEFHCPLCGALKDHNAALDEALMWEKRFEDLNGEDVEVLRDERDEAQEARWRAETALRELTYAIECERPKGLRERLERLREMVRRQRREAA